MNKKKRTNHEEEHIDETWLIPYADLLTLLLALFIVLFASSIIDQQRLDQISKSFSIAFNDGISLLPKSRTREVSRIYQQHEGKAKR